MGIKRFKDEPGRAWLSQSGAFIFGKYRGLLAEEVVVDDPSYIRWIVNDVEDILEEDREILSQYLAYRSR